MPAAPALVAGVAEAAWLSQDGEITILPLAEAARRARATPPILCHARATARRLGVMPFPALDVLELFAFVRPAQFCLPTPRGLARATGLAPPHDLAAAAAALLDAARMLLGALGAEPADADTGAIAQAMARGGWGWAASVLAALGPASAGATPWPAWRNGWRSCRNGRSSRPNRRPAISRSMRARRARVWRRCSAAMPRRGRQQADYAAAVSAAFRPREREGEPQIVLAEAGTGVGKTLGYIAPASVWAEKNQGPVWVSTFTRNLQRQIDVELDKLYPDPRRGRAEKRVVLRKGRENYLCLLNYEEAASRRCRDAAL